MKNYSENNIKKIAIKIRNEFENKTVNYKFIKIIYKNYNPNIIDISSFIHSSKILFPSLNCGLASVYLKEKLGKGKIVMGKYKKNNHTFLTINGLIVDITSDQYGGPKVYVGKIQKPWSQK